MRNDIVEKAVADLLSNGGFHCDVVISEAELAAIYRAWREAIEWDDPIDEEQNDD